MTKTNMEISKRTGKQPTKQEKRMKKNFPNSLTVNQRQKLTS
jgi:hypothetical protein